jgi:hypothetical protein
VGGAGFRRGPKLGRPAARSPGRDGAPAVARRREVAEAVQPGLAELRAAPICSHAGESRTNPRRAWLHGVGTRRRGGSDFTRLAAVLRRRAGRAGARLSAFYRGGSLGVHGTDAEEKVGGSGASRVLHGHWGSWGSGPRWAFAGGLVLGPAGWGAGLERTGLRPAETKLRQRVEGGMGKL